MSERQCFQKPKLRESFDHCLSYDAVPFEAISMKPIFISAFDKQVKFRTFSILDRRT